jgi:trigger factor
LDVKVKESDNWTRVVEVKVPREELEPHFQKAYKEFRKKLSLQGFRKGHVPLSLVKRLYGEGIEAEAIDDIVTDIFKEVRQREGLKVVAPAKVRKLDYGREDGLEFEVEVEVEPEVELREYKGLSVEKEKYIVSEEDVDAALEELREQHGAMVPVEGEAQLGHFVLVDFQKLDESGVPVIGHKYEDRFLQLDEESTGKELTEQLLGVKAGETRVLRLPMQDESGQQRVEVYSATVREVQQKELPALDDEFAKDVGPYESLEELRAAVRKRLEERFERETEKTLRSRLADEVIKRNPFDLPAGMIEAYLDRLVKAAREDNPNELNEEELREAYRARAVWNLKWALLREKITEAEGLTVTKEDKEAYIKRIAAERRVPERTVRKLYRGPRGQENLETDVLEDKVLDFLREHAKIKERKITRKDIEKAKALEI